MANARSGRMITAAYMSSPTIFRYALTSATGGEASAANHVPCFAIGMGMDDLSKDGLLADMNPLLIATSLR